MNRWIRRMRRFWRRPTTTPAPTTPAPTTTPAPSSGEILELDLRAMTSLPPGRYQHAGDRADHFRMVDGMKIRLRDDDGESPQGGYRSEWIADIGPAVQGQEIRFRVDLYIPPNFGPEKTHLLQIKSRRGADGKSDTPLQIWAENGRLYERDRGDVQMLSPDAEGELMLSRSFTLDQPPRHGIPEWYVKIGLYTGPMQWPTRWVTVRRVRIEIR